MNNVVEAFFPHFTWTHKCGVNFESLSVFRGNCKANSGHYIHHSCPPAVPYSTMRYVHEEFSWNSYFEFSL